MSVFSLPDESCATAITALVAGYNNANQFEPGSNQPPVPPPATMFSACDWELSGVAAALVAFGLNWTTPSWTTPTMRHVCPRTCCEQGLPPFDCNRMPSYCRDVCSLFSYCANVALADAACANAPADCSQRCNSYVNCMYAPSPPPADRAEGVFGGCVEGSSCGCYTPDTYPEPYASSPLAQARLRPFFVPAGVLLPDGCYHERRWNDADQTMGMLFRTPCPLNPSPPPPPPPSPPPSPQPPPSLPFLSAVMSGTVALQSANGEYLTCTSDVIGSSPTLGAAEVFEIREIAGDATGRLTIFAVDHGKYVRFNWGTPKCDVSNPDQSWEQWYLVPRGDSAYGILGAEYSTQYMSIDQSGSPGSSANAGSPDTTFHLILQPAPPPAPPPCGVESCTEAVLAAQAEGTSCRGRISWLQNHLGYGEDRACRRIAVREFPAVCGACRPPPATPTPLRNVTYVSPDSGGACVASALTGVMVTVRCCPHRRSRAVPLPTCRLLDLTPPPEYSANS